MNTAEEVFLRQLLGKKLSEASEIELHFSTYCNLRCAACGQDHESTEGLDTIVGKAQLVCDFISQSPLDRHTVNMMGGEIFNDEIPESVFPDYLEFCRTIQAHCDALGHSVRFNFVTNLIFERNIPHVIALLQEVGLNAHISTSYDFAGRGLNLNQSLRFKHNLKVFSAWVGVIGFVMTRPSIRKLLADKDRYFKEELYPNYHLYFDWYVPEASAEKLMPSEREMLDALNFLALNYPKMSPVKDLLENTHNQLTCQSLNKVTIEPSGRTITCRYLEYQPEQFQSEVNYQSNANIIEAHLARHDCLSCKWYNRCSFRCFVQADWAALEREPECIFKTFFNTHIGSPAEA